MCNILKKEGNKSSFGSKIKKIVIYKDYAFNETKEKYDLLDI